MRLRNVERKLKHLSSSPPPSPLPSLPVHYLLTVPLLNKRLSASHVTRIGGGTEGIAMKKTNEIPALELTFE